VVTLNPKVEDLKKLTGKSMQLYQLQADDQEIQLRNGVFDEEMVWTDPIIAQTILRNLLSNALKFTNSKGFIEVSSQRLEEKVIVQVKDNGMGMSTEKSRQLFGPVPVHSRRGIQGEQGTGLGLKICKEFMDKLGERIWVESEPGKGTSFYFTLPVAFGFRYHPSVMRQ
jgi:signal transduction histidine kinase